MEKYTKKIMKYVETEVDVFMANDGKQFGTEQECLDYEAQLEEREKRRTQLLIPELNGVLPAATNLGYCEDDDFSWYRLNSEDDFEFLNEYYEDDLNEPGSYPEIICVQEQYDHDENLSYLLTDIISDLNRFLGRFGYQAVEK